jgi:uncharacterized alpha-E superfamily protein
MAMLSRTADHLYWMSRYIERAEGVARMLDAHVRLALLPRSPEAVLQGWTATLVSLGAEAGYAGRHGQVAPDAALDWLAFDRTNSGSIISCLRLARENARAVRGTITAEMWETLNSTYLDSRAVDSQAGGSAAPEFLEWVKQRSHLTRGVTVGTMLRDEAFHFTRIGLFLERADNVSRILEARWRDPGQRGERLGTEASEWSVLLRSLSAFEVYRRIYRTVVTPLRVTELLLLHENMPRSVQRSLGDLTANLMAVANDRSAEVCRQAGALHASFHFGRFDDLVGNGIPQALDDLQARLREIGSGISRDFLVPDLAA